MMINTKNLRLCTGLLLIAVSLPCLAAEQSDSRINWKGVSLIPSLDLSTFYDSNTKLDERDEDGINSQAQLNLDASREIGPFILGVNLWGRMSNYSNESDLNTESFGHTLQLGFTDAFEKFNVTLDYQQLAEYDTSQLYTKQGPLTAKDSAVYTREGVAVPQDRSDRQERDVFNSGLGFSTPISDKTDISLNVNYSFVDYDDDASYDSDTTGLNSSVSYQVTEKTAAFIDADYSVTDSDGNDNNSIFYALRLGAKTITTEKLTFSAGFGASWSEADSGPDGDTDTSTDFNFNVGAAWQATEKLSFALGAENGVSAAADAANNTKEFMLFTASGNYQVTETILFNLTGGYAYEEYTNDAINPLDTTQTPQNRDQDIFMFRTRLSYTPPADFMTVYLEAQANAVDDSFGEDYEQYRIGIGMKIWY